MTLRIEAVREGRRINMFVPDGLGRPQPLLDERGRPVDFAREGWEEALSDLELHLRIRRAADICANLVRSRIHGD